MNLELITKDLLGAGRYFAKPAPRKSDRQPHTWLAGDRLARYVVKFAAGSPHAAALVRNEVVFYEAAGKVSGADDVTGALARLVHRGRLAAGPFLVLEHSRGRDATRWMGRALRFGHYGRILRWQAGALEWLDRMQDCGPLRAALGVPRGRVVCHNDFNHFNVLGRPGGLTVVDWENWSPGEWRFLDAFHLLVTPTLAGDSPEQAAARFASYWLSDNPYRRGALELLGPFLRSRDWRECVAEYLGFQRKQLLDKAASIARSFGLAAQLWAQG